MICLYRRASELIIASLGSGGFFLRVCFACEGRPSLICNCMRKCEDVSELHIGLLGPTMSYGANQVEAFRWEVSMSGRFSRAKSQPTASPASTKIETQDRPSVYSHQPSTEHFQQCAEFLPLRNRGLGTLAMTVLPVSFAGRAAATACAAVQATTSFLRSW